MVDLDEYYMSLALKEANQAFDDDEVPIGAVVISEGQILAKAHNQTERLTDVTAHAEMIAITSAANTLGSKYLTNCSIYVTVEPCMMCATALFWSKIDAIYYGAADNKYGFTQFNNIFTDKTYIQQGLLEHDCADLMKSFFQKKRDLDQLK